MCGAVKTATNILNMAVYLPKVNMWYIAMKNIISPFFFEEHLVTGGKFLATMEETALCHVPAGTAFQLGVVASHFSCPSRQGVS
jgi:hypothetical protein